MSTFIPLSRRDYLLLVESSRNMDYFSLQELKIICKSLGVDSLSDIKLKKIKRIILLPDEWYIIQASNDDRGDRRNYQNFKCDQLEGVIECIKSIIN